MKLSKMAMIAAIACGIHAGTAFGQQANNQIQQVSCADCDCGQPACGCEAPACCDDPSCDDGCSSCDSCGIGDGCLMASMHDKLFCGELGEPWTLFGEHCGWTAGGWTAIGYHSNNTQFNFNNYANRVQLQQQWLYAEKVADGSEGLGLGGRIDYLYGTDAQDTQSFGIANTHWDNSWDNGGAYGHAIPQLYLEAAYGDTSVKVGHFFTIIGNEVVQATGNFFYSRQFTFYNAEPFTHTGVLATHALDDCTTLWGGYVMGWDSGFEDNGDAYLGGFKRQLTEDTSFIYTTALGRFNDDPASVNAGERGSIHSFIVSSALTDKLTGILQYDTVDTENAAGANVRRTDGVIGYMIYQLSDRLAFGTRTEYFDGDIGPAETIVFNQTWGINYKVSSNLMVRPELRYVDDKDRFGILQNQGGANDRRNTIFGMDAVYTF